jgi:EmrB/QacA subfamily drug resistance transporter
MEKKSLNLKWIVLLTVIIGTFLGRLDQTIVNLALPKIMDDFKISQSAVGWIATAYILANAVFVPIWGKLGDTIGRKKVYLMGFSIFILGSALAGFAWNLTSMIVFRIIQAVAGSADYPTAMSILAATFEDGKERAQAMGIWSASFAAAVVFGPLLGGPLIDNFGWRSVFLINIPVGIIGAVMAIMFIKESIADKGAKYFDWWGAAALGVCLSTLVLVLEKGYTWKWLSLASIICYAITIIAGIIFVKIEKGQKEPIVDLKFFKNEIFVTTMINNFIIFMAMMGAVYMVPYFVQIFLGYDATQTGYLFMPMAFMMMLAAPLGGNLVGKVKPKYVIAASTLVAAIGVFMFTGLDARSNAMAIIIPISIMAFGMGFGMAQRTNIVTTAVPPEEVGSASSVLALVRNIAGAFGIAVFGTILNNSITNKVLETAYHSTINATSQLIYQQGASLIILNAYMASYKVVFITAGVLLLVGAAAALAINVSKEDMANAKQVHIEA